MSVTTDVQQIVPESQSYNDISLTDKAREHLTKLLTERNIPDHGLRVFVSGVGALVCNMVWLWKVNRVNSIL